MGERLPPLETALRAGSGRAVRSLWIDTPANSDVWMAFVWCFVLLAIFVPLAINRYRTVTAR